MTTPAPKPIADCPNPECKHFCAMYEAPFVSNDGLMHKVKCDDCGYMGPWARTSDEAIRLHNLLCRSNPETQVVAEYHAPMVLIESPDYAEYLRTHPSRVLSQETRAVATNISPGAMRNIFWMAFNWNDHNSKVESLLDACKSIAKEVGVESLDEANEWLESYRPPVESVPASELNKLVDHWAVWSRHFSPEEVSIINKCRSALAEVIKARGTKP